jgi:cysteine desulfurase family protein (TIGR01976 family)
MAYQAPTIESVRERFTALRNPLAFFDGPAGTQVPDSVIESISAYLQAANANLGGAFMTSKMSDGLVDAARVAASELLGVYADEVIFGANSTSLNFVLTRTAAREWGEGDEVVATKLDHDANVSPWLELAHDKGITVHLCDFDGEGRLDLDHLRSLLSERTRVVAFPWASNALGTVTPVDEIVALAHEAGALAWCDAVHYAPHGPIELEKVAIDVLLCSPYKFYGPHLGVATARRELLERWRPYKVRPAPDEPLGHRFETGTLAHELLSGFIAAVEYVQQTVGWKFIREQEAALGQRLLDGLPDAWILHGPPTMEGRVSTFAITHAEEPPEAAAERLADAGFAVWHGNHYALEVMKRLGLDDGALRVGIVHYNTEDEVDRLLAELGAA